MIKIVTVRDIEGFAAKTRPKTSEKSRKIVQGIIADVRKNGDSAVRKYEKKFGSAIGSLRVSQREIRRAYSQVSPEQLAAIRAARKVLQASERAVKSRLGGLTVRTGGVKISKSFVPIISAGCYVPGGLARYPSSAIMSVVPAKIAGVGRIVVITPPDKSGKADPLTLVAADICGATEIYKTGGAQGIAALAFGTKSVRPVDKIVGPGGEFVTLAKFLVSESTAIDMLAGPTELGIVADASSSAEYAALDLISQAEHSRDTRCYMITDSLPKAREVARILNELIKDIPRKEIIRASLGKNGFIAVCKTRNEMIELANRLAPEHLEIIAKNPQALAGRIRTSGLVLIGKNTPSSASDYLLGTNHILPTCGFGRVRGSLSVLDFVKLDTTVAATRGELNKISRHVRELTSSEGLPNHYTALEGRLG